MGTSILIVSASMGAGHDGAARELQRRLHARGHEAEVVDLLDMAPLGGGKLLKWSYELQLKFAPWTYQLTYRLWFLMPFLYGPVVWFDTFVTRRRMRRTINAMDPDAVVSTYCLATLVLGNMRRKGWLRVPVVTFLTDFAVHPLCVHPSVDLDLGVSPSAAAAALERGAPVASAPGPLVSERFRVGVPSRAAVRSELGLGPDERAVLVVAGSWGVGEVVDTVRTLGREGLYHPITVCGKDTELKARLDQLGIGTVVGWTSEMPSLMAAADALVENAGGLTAMEAFASGLPVITFNAIPGHGRDNGARMEVAGVSIYARSEEELAPALALATTPGPDRDLMIENARALFAGDAADDVLALAGSRAPVPVAFGVPKGPRRLVGTAASLIVLYGSLTVGAQAVSAMGVGVARVPVDATQTVYTGIRLNQAELNDRGIQKQIAALHATAIVDGMVAQSNPKAVARLAGLGIDIGNGGWGKTNRMRWSRASNDVKHAAKVINADTGRTVAREFIPMRRVDAFDLVYSRTTHQKVVIADRVMRKGTKAFVLHGRKVVVIDGKGRTTAELKTALRQYEQRLDGHNLVAAPFSGLR
ncbi:MAG: glycosyl transferase group 1 [Actinomycetia bacterium]|nr:glycosyl transferase group 1 [Actinomycetes bacterium]